MRVGKTVKEQVALATKILGQVDAKLLGSVMNLASRAAMGEVVYGYGRSYGYGSTYQHYGPTPEKPSRRKKPSLVSALVESSGGEAVPARAIDPER